MKEYTLGFLFDQDVGLWLGVFKENGPKCNHQKWNGIGGKVERHETPLCGMIREGEEEIGQRFDWQSLGVFLNKRQDWRVHVYRAPHDHWSTLPLNERNDIGELISWRGEEFDRSIDAYNLSWLLPLVFAPYVTQFCVMESE